MRDGRDPDRWGTTTGREKKIERGREPTVTVIMVTFVVWLAEKQTKERNLSPPPPLSYSGATILLSLAFNVNCVLHYL